MITMLVLKIRLWLPFVTGTFFLFSVDTKICLSSSCQNGAKCLPSTASPGYTCSCPTGYTGTLCEIGKSMGTEGLKPNGKLSVRSIL